jgi:hypothetical protein
MYAWQDTPLPFPNAQQLNNHQHLIAINLYHSLEDARAISEVMPEPWHVRMAGCPVPFPENSA